MAEHLCRRILAKCTAEDGVFFNTQIFQYIGKNKLKYGNTVYTISRNFIQLQNIICKGQQHYQTNGWKPEWIEQGLHYGTLDVVSTQKAICFFMMIDDIIVPFDRGCEYAWIMLPTTINLSLDIENWQTTQLTRLKQTKFSFMKWMAESDEILPSVLHQIIVNYMHGITFIEEEEES